MKFRFLSHTADSKIRVYGRNLREIIENSLLALKSFWQPKLTQEKIEIAMEIKKEKNKPEELLIDFLSEVLAQTYIQKAVFLKFIPEKVNFKEIKGKMLGYKFTNLAKDIKAITYHQAKLEKKEKKWFFEFIIDI